MPQELRVAQTKNNTAFDQAFVDQDVRIVIHGPSNRITVYTNDWETQYRVVLKGGAPQLELIGCERAYR